MYCLLSCFVITLRELNRNISHFYLVFWLGPYTKTLDKKLQSLFIKPTRKPSIVLVWTVAVTNSIQNRALYSVLQKKISAAELQMTKEHRLSLIRYIYFTTWRGSISRFSIDFEFFLKFTARWINSSSVKHYFNYFVKHVLNQLLLYIFQLLLLLVLLLYCLTDWQISFWKLAQ